MALHEQSVGSTDEWYTPPEIFRAMGAVFDLDVASPGRDVVPWVPAVEHLTAGSLEAEWRGFVWMNPPFGPRNGIVPWLEKFIAYRNGVCLVPDRTSAPWWQAWAVRMELILFVSPKPRFVNATGEPGPSPPNGVCLGALGAHGVAALRRARSFGLGVLMRNE